MSTMTHAYQCYKAGEQAFAHGFYLDAQTSFDRACRLEPGNALYQTARERLRVLAFQFGKKGGLKGSDLGKAFTEGCCECCCEGGCDLLCEGICSNCDCDCG